MAVSFRLMPIRFFLGLNAADIAANKEDIATNKEGIAENKGDIETERS